MMIYLIAFLLLHPLLAALYVLWAKTRSKVIAAPALLIDVLLNYTTAAVIWGWPRPGEWTISKRMRRARAFTGWRGYWAWRLADWLNKHDPGHVS